MAKSSLFSAFESIILALNKLATEFIKWPSGERVETVKAGFKKLKQIENIVGAVDGTYCPIKAPTSHPRSYICRKCFHAVTLQAICDHELQFTDCFAGYPSSVHDARIFNNSDVYKEILMDQKKYFPNGEFILGDKAYPLLSWCIPPFIDNGRLTGIQKQFNYFHAATRQVIERAFALLFGRFRRLKYLDMNRTDLIAPTILAACVLHNICLKFKSADDIETYIQDSQTPVSIPTVSRENVEIENCNVMADQSGVNLRNKIISKMLLSA